MHKLEEKKQKVAGKMGKRIPDITAKDEKKVLSSIKRKGFYASPAAKKAIKESDKKYEAYEKERKVRYAREGITE